MSSELIRTSKPRTALFAVYLDESWCDRAVCRTRSRMASSLQASFRGIRRPTCEHCRRNSRAGPFRALRAAPPGPLDQLRRDADVAGVRSTRFPSANRGFPAKPCLSAAATGRGDPPPPRDRSGSGGFFRPPRRHPRRPARRRGSAPTAALRRMPRPARRAPRRPAAPRSPSCAGPTASRHAPRRPRSSSGAEPRSSSHERVWSRPSIATCWPLPRYVPAISARRSHVTTGWYSAFSFPCPMNSFVATVNVVTFLPLARLRISGSRVRRPVRKTLFTVGISFPVGRWHRSRPCVFRRERGGLPAGGRPQRGPPGAGRRFGGAG